MHSLLILHFFKIIWKNICPSVARKSTIVSKNNILIKLAYNKILFINVWKKYLPARKSIIIL